MKLDQCRITANSDAVSLSIAAGSITASTTSRTIGGQLVKYGVLGHTSRGLLKVAPGALRFPDELTRVKLTREHDRSSSRGHLVALEHVPDGIRASFKVADGTEGDDALREAADKTRDGLSYDIINAVIQGDTIISADVIAGGQVGIPAYSGLHIDSIAASQTPAQPTGENMTPEQLARLTALRAQQTRSDAEQAELATLETAAAAQPAPAAAAPAVPAATSPTAGTPAPAAAAPAPAATAPAGVPVAASAQAQVTEPGGLTRFAELVAEYMSPGGRTEEVTAALADVTSTQHTAHIEPQSWSGELWSGGEYAPQFMDLFTHGDLTSWEGRGWRWGTKPAVGDYAGDKADIPTNTPTTVASTYDAFRIAGGWDIDRKFFDFPNAAFIASFLAAAMESYRKKLDFHVRDYIIATAVAPVGVTSQANLLKAARIATKWVKRNTDGAPATFILVNDDDLDSLFDITNDDVPAFLKLFNIDPSNFRASQDIAAGTVYAGVKQAATVRELPGASPLRVEVQNLSKAGIDDAIFGYAAIEEHHTTGIVKVPFAVVDEG